MKKFARLVILVLVGSFIRAGSTIQAQEGNYEPMYAASLKLAFSPQDVPKKSVVVKIGPQTGAGAYAGEESAGLDQFQWPADLAFAPDGTRCVNETERVYSFATVDIDLGAGAIASSTESLIKGIAFDNSLLYADIVVINWRGGDTVKVDTSDFTSEVSGGLEYSMGATMTNITDRCIQELPDEHSENFNYKNTSHGKFTFAQNMIEIGSEQGSIVKSEYDTKDKVWKWSIFPGKPQKPENKEEEGIIPRQWQSLDAIDILIVYLKTLS